MNPIATAMINDETEKRLVAKWTSSSEGFLGCRSKLNRGAAISIQDAGKISKVAGDHAQDCWIGRLYVPEVT